jgi:hypothetical protein
MAILGRGTIAHVETTLLSGGLVADDQLLKLGTTSDIVLVSRSTALSADATLGSVIEGSPDHPGVAANSLIISNVTNDGDIMLAISDGGNSKGLIKLNGADGTVDITANLLPTDDDTWDLGTTTKAWQDLYLEGDLHFTDSATIDAGGNTITLDENVKIHDGDLFLDAAAGEAQLQFQYAGSWKFLMGINSNFRFFLRNTDADGGGTDTDTLRIDTGQNEVDFDAAANASAYDDYDDAMVLAAAYSPTAESYKLGKDMMARGQDLLTQIGVLKKYEDGWLGYNPQRMDALMAGAIYQSRTTIDTLSDKIRELEAQVMSLKGDN